MNKIPLSKGRFAIVDSEDFERLSRFNWYYSTSKNRSSGYATCSTPPFRNIRMHRMIMGAKKWDTVDHVNRDTLDNRKENLRFVTKSFNCRNISAKNKYGLTGIRKRKNKWLSQISFHEKNIHLGVFKTKIEAAAAYIGAYKVLEKLDLAEDDKHE